MTQTVVVVETNRAGSGTAALVYARSLGFRTEFFCGQPAEYDNVDPNPIAVADSTRVVDTLHVGQLLREVDGRNDIVAALAYDDLAVVPAAIIGEYLSLPFSPAVSSVVRCRFKDRFRAALADSPWTTPHAVVPLTSTESPIDYPCVVKPTDVAGNYGVTVCRTQTDYLSAIGLLQNLSTDIYGRGYRPIPAALVEQFVVGPEYSAELVWSERRSDWIVIGFTTKQLASDDNPIEIEHIFPHHFPEDVSRATRTDLAACLNLIGLRHVVVHAEFRLGNRGLVLIEVNCRPAGGHINDLSSLVAGASLVQFDVAAHLGRADALLEAFESKGFAGVRFILPEQAGALLETATIPPTPILGVLEVHLPSASIETEIVLNSDSRLGYVVACGDSEQEVSDRLAQQTALVRQTYSEDPS